MTEGRPRRRVAPDLRKTPICFFPWRDGTANGDVDAMAGTNRAVCVLPVGTGNLLARALRFRSLCGAPAVAAQRRRTPSISAARDGRLFAVAAGPRRCRAGAGALRGRRRLGVFCIRRERHRPFASQGTLRCSRRWTARHRRDIRVVAMLVTSDRAERTVRSVRPLLRLPAQP